MTNDEKDRHVLATAVVSDAQAVVTLNLKDFPVEACEPFAIEPLHPDVFLLDLYHLDRQEVFEAASPAEANAHAVLVDPARDQDHTSPARGFSASSA